MWKIVFAFFSFLLLSFLIFFTFFVSMGSEDVGFSSFDIRETKYIVEASGWILWENLEWSSTVSWSGKILFERISPLSEVFFTKGAQYKVEKKSPSELNITLQEWNFIFKLQDPAIKVTVRWEWFYIQPESVGEFSVKTTSDKQQSIFSFTSLLNVKFTDLVNKNDLAQVYLFPRKYVFFNAARNTSIQNADRIRIESVFSLWYRDTQLFPDAKTSKISSSWTVDTFFIRSKFEKDFFSNYIIFSKKSSLDLSNKLQFFKSQQSFYSIPGLEFVQKYISFFYNDTKKTSYIKNLLLFNLTKLLKSQDNEKDLIETIMVQMKELKNLSIKDYDEMKQTFYVYLYLIVNQSNSIPQETELNFYALNSKISYETNLNLKYKSYFWLNNLFSNFDFESTRFFYKKLDAVIDQFFFDNDLDTKDMRNDIKNQKNKNVFDYFSFFLEKILLLNLSTAVPEDMWDVINVMEKFTLLNNLLYSEWDEKRKITWMSINLNLLVSLEDYILNTYFQENKSEKGLLLKKNSTQVKAQHVRSLKRNYEALKTFYQENSKFLNEQDYKDAELKSSYEKTFKAYDEYFLALTDYDNYELNYDAINKALIDAKTINQSENEELSDVKIRSYLSWFYWVDAMNANIEVKDNTYYDIQNVVIEKKKFSFKIFPLNDNELRGIYIDWIPKQESYKLDLIKDNYADKLQQSNLPEVQNKYDFRNFFLQAFFGKWQVSHTPQDNQNDDEKSVKDPCPGSKYTNELRRKILSPTKWEFKTFKDYFDVKFENLCIKSFDQKIDITLTGAVFRYDATRWFTQGSHVLDLYSAYHLNDTEHFFENISLRIFQDYTSDKSLFAMWNNSISIQWKVNIYDFDKYMNDLYPQIQHILTINGALIWTLNVWKIDTTYSYANKRVTIKFDFKAKKAIITVASWKIQSFIFGGKNFISSPIQVVDIPTVIKNLK